MAAGNTACGRILVLTLLFFFCAESTAKLASNKTEDSSAENEAPPKLNGNSVLLFADELKQTLEKYLFGICPQNYKVHWSQMGMTAKSKNSTLPTCDLDAEQHDLAGRLAALALRAHSASRTHCLRFGSVLANTLGELARTAADRQANAGSTNETNKKRKLSKSQKMKIQAKQRTALAVKKKAAALAAAAAAKLATS